MGCGIINPKPRQQSGIAAPSHQGGRRHVKLDPHEESAATHLHNVGVRGLRFINLGCMVESVGDQGLRRSRILGLCLGFRVEG